MEKYKNNDADISKTQDADVGDGTTSVCVLAGELLREGEKLLHQKIHPQTIVEGYRLAVDAAMEALEGSAVDNGADPGACLGLYSSYLCIHVHEFSSFSLRYLFLSSVLERLRMQRGSARI